MPPPKVPPHLIPVWEALQRGAVDDAIAALPLARSSFDIGPPKEQIEAILCSRPTILGNQVSPADLKEMQLAAAYAAMVGVGTDRLGVVGPKIGRFNWETAARMVQFGGGHAYQLQHLKEVFGSFSFEVLVDPSACDACKVHVGRVFHCDEAPELPHPACTHMAGCRCDIIPRV